MKFFANKKIFLAWLIGFVLFTNVLLPIHTAHAIPVEDPGALAQRVVQIAQKALSTAHDAITSKAQTSLWLKEYVLDPLSTIAARVIIRAVTQQILGWVQGENAGFVQNLDQEFRSAADEAGGAILNQLSTLNLCGNFNAFLNISLKTPSLRQKLQCTVSNIVENIQNHYANFRQGGLGAFVKFSLEPQNTLNGAFLIALDAKIAAETNAKQRTERTLSLGERFKGFEVPVQKNCVKGASSTGSGGGLDNPGFTQVNPENLKTVIKPVRNRGVAAIGAGAQRIAQLTEEDARLLEDIERVEQAETGEIGTAEEQATSETANRNMNCVTEYETKTPGKLIADGLSKSVYSGIDSAVVADEINEAIGLIITALLQKVITGIGTSDNPSIVDSGFSVPEIPVVSNPSVLFFTGQIDETLLRLQARQIALGEEMSRVTTTLVGIKRQLADLQNQLVPARNQCNSFGTESASCALVSNLEAQQASAVGRQTAAASEKAELVRKLGPIDTMVVQLLQLRNGLPDTTDPEALQRITSSLHTVLIEANRTLNQDGQVAFGSTITSGDPIDAVLETAGKTEQYASVALLMLDQNIQSIGTSSPANSLEVELQTLRTVYSTNRGTLQSIVNEAVSIRLRLVSERSRGFSVTEPIASQLLQKLIELDRKTTELLKL